MSINNNIKYQTKNVQYRYTLCVNTVKDPQRAIQKEISEKETGQTTFLILL